MSAPDASSPIAVAPARPRLGAGAIAVAALAWTGLMLAAEPAAKWTAIGLLRLEPGGRLASSVTFFLAETPRLLLLLVAVSFAMTVVNSYFTVERIQALLAGRREYVGNVLAALLGVVTPFCSCSAVPLFIGFVEGGIPLGVTFSFLVSAPMVNEIALVMLLGLFGWRVAVLYLASGLVIAVASGFVIGRLRLDSYVEGWVRERTSSSGAPAEAPLVLAERAAAAASTVGKLTRRVWPYLLVAMAVGAVLHGYVPDGVLEHVAGRSAWWSVPLAVAAGIPLYSNALAIVPMIQPLLMKGAATGTVLAFMMAVVGLSAPELIILRKVLKPQLIACLVGIVATGILLTGWLFNAIL